MSRLRKKILTTVVIAVVAASVAAPVQAQTIEDLQAQISALLAQITALQVQLSGLGGDPVGPSGIPAGFTFDTNLSQGSSSQDVMYLQMAFNANSDTQLAASGVGSAGNETQFFGPLTRAAAVKYQEKFTSQILTPVGLSSGTGFVGPSTRAQLNSWLAVAPPPPPPPGTPPPPPGVTGNTLQITLASDTPVGGSLARSGNANFIKFFLTAGDQEVTVSKILVTRQGFTANADLENVKILDANGVTQGSIGSFNVNNKASLTFSPNLVIPAGQSDAFWIRAGFVSNITSGKTARLGIDSGSDVTSSADSVTGAPVFGNDLTAVALTIGSLNVDEQGATVDSQPDVGDTNVIVNNFRAAAGSTEGVTIDQITVMESGSASLSDTGNIELFDVTNNVSLGTVTSWDSGGRASWSDLNIVVDKGKTQRFRVQLDILDGPGLAVNADLIDGSDVLISVRGNTYGFFITPAIDSDWNGLGNSNQSIQSGSLTVSKSTATPATGNIAAADDQKLATFDFIVKGEEMRVTALRLQFDRSGITCAEIRSVRLFDADDNILAGPLDCSSDFVSFTDTFIVPVGTNEYSVIVNIDSAVTTGDTVNVGINLPGANMTVRGLISNDTVTATPATEVEGNTMTVAAGALVVTNLTTPAARSISQGSDNFIFATFSMDANGSGEDVQVTVITVKDDPGAGATAASADELNNVEIWADLTTANSARGDIYETRIADPVDFDETAMDTVDTIAFTLNQTVVVALNSFVRAAVVADLDTGASNNGTHTVNISAVTANGADTGETVTVSAPGGNGQAITTTTGGTLTVTIDSSEPNASLVAGGDQVTLGIFRLAANNVEDLDLDSIALTVTNGGRVSTYYFYQGSTLLGSRPSGTTPSIEFADGTVTIPANDKVLITVKGDMEVVTLVSQNNTGIQIAIADGPGGDVGATGLASGSTVTSSNSNVDANTHTLFESYPIFSVNSGSPSGDLIPGSNTLLAIFDVTAHANEDITFQDGDNNTLTIQISQSVTTSNGVTTETWRLRDSSGAQLASTTVDTFDATLVVFDFASQDFNVPGGQTKSLHVYADTSEMTTNGDVIQLWLDDGSATNIDWGIDGTGNYNHADIIFRGDIFARSLVNPS
ncbi:peptidoglycan-binding protein [Patescibacteria group bacterium]|nr:peptidoglycan-binding protein [Patescibacteria group bacterium]